MKATETRRNRTRTTSVVRALKVRGWRDFMRGLGIGAYVGQSERGRAYYEMGWRAGRDGEECP